MRIYLYNNSVVLHSVRSDNKSMRNKDIETADRWIRKNVLDKREDETFEDVEESDNTMKYVFGSDEGIVVYLITVLRGSITSITREVHNE